MLATLNSRQIVNEIVKDTMKDNDPHDAVQISSDVVLASRTHSDAPSLAPEITNRPEPKIDVAPAVAATTAPSVDTAIRVTANDMPGREKRSAIGRWLRGAFITMLFAGGSAAATIVWESHGDTARQMLAEWTPSLMSLVPSSSPTTPVATAQAATDQTTDQSAAPIAVQDAAPAQSDATQSLQSMTRDVAAMAQQIAQLKANIAELKTAQEQMAREMVKTSAPKPVAEAKPIDPRTRVSALPPRPPVAPVRKPKPITTPAYPQTFAPTQIAPPPLPSQAVAVPPPPAAAAQAVADDDGPVVRPPMPVH